MGDSLYGRGGGQPYTNQAANASPAQSYGADILDHECPSHQVSPTSVKEMLQPPDELGGKSQHSKPISFIQGNITGPRTSQRSSAASKVRACLQSLAQSTFDQSSGVLSFGGSAPSERVNLSKLIIPAYQFEKWDPSESDSRGNAETPVDGAEAGREESIVLEAMAARKGGGPRKPLSLRVDTAGAYDLLTERLIDELDLECSDVGKTVDTWGVGGPCTYDEMRTAHCWFRPDEVPLDIKFCITDNRAIRKNCDGMITRATYKRLHRATVEHLEQRDKGKLGSSNIK